MAEVLGNVASQLEELQQYKARFGELAATDAHGGDRDEEFELIDNSDEDEVEGSDTEQE